MCQFLRYFIFYLKIMIEYHKYTSSWKHEPIRYFIVQIILKYEGREKIHDFW